MKSPQLLLWRQNNRLSQELAAQRLGRSLRTYIRYEKGESPIPDVVAATVLATPNIHAPEVELAPKIAPGEHPGTHPHLYRKHPTKMRWDRIDPGTPLTTASDPGWYPKVMEHLDREAEELRRVLAMPEPLSDDYVHEPDGD